ncbi:hypothetical protein FACS189430_07180 [Bacteroidia bacterium]|nr:hypothetical protein FACS189430_07180 [Bacteroidia bacterium]
MISCVSKKKNPISEQACISIQWEELIEKDLFFTDDKIDSCRFVPLETNDKCLIGAIIKVKMTNNLIFVEDNNSKLFVFDKNGKFLNLIGKIGPGPDELLSLMDFYVNEDAGYVGVLDILRETIFRYSFDGLLREKVRCGSVMKGMCQIQGLSNGKLLLSVHNDMENDFNYVFVNETDYSLYKKTLPYLAQGTEHTCLIEPRATVLDNRFYATAMLSDTIYSYMDGDIRPCYVLQTPLKKSNKDIIMGYGPYQFGLSAERHLKNNGYSPGIHNMYAIKDYLYFTYLMKEKYYRVYWNITDKKGYITLWRDTHNIFDLMAPIMATTHDAFVCVISSDQAVECLQKFDVSDSRILKLMENVQEEDNPILAFYYIKDTDI